MANVVSSLIGVDLSGVGGTTQVFALGTPALGSMNSEWAYVEATATFVTGEIVLINQGEFGWVAKRGKDLYVLVTGTLTAASDNGLALGANSGRLVPGTAGGNTLFGVVLTESVSASGVRSVAKAVLTYPRFQTTVYT